MYCYDLKCLPKNYRLATMLRRQQGRRSGMTNNKSFVAGMMVANLLVLVSLALGWDTLNYGVSAIGIALLGTALMSFAKSNTRKAVIKFQPVRPRVGRTTQNS